MSFIKIFSAMVAVVATLCFSSAYAVEVKSSQPCDEMERIRTELAQLQLKGKQDFTAITRLDTRLNWVSGQLKTSDGRTTKELGELRKLLEEARRDMCSRTTDAEVQKLCVSSNVQIVSDKHALDTYAEMRNGVIPTRRVTRDIGAGLKEEIVDFGVLVQSGNSAQPCIDMTRVGRNAAGDLNYTSFRCPAVPVVIQQGPTMQEIAVKAEADKKASITPPATPAAATSKPINWATPLIGAGLGGLTGASVGGAYFGHSAEDRPDGGHRDDNRFISAMGGLGVGLGLGFLTGYIVDRI